MAGEAVTVVDGQQAGTSSNCSGWQFQGQGGDHQETAAGGQVGGISVSDGAQLAVEESTIRDNVAEGLLPFGGGVMNAGTMCLNRVRVIANQSAFPVAFAALSRGGGIFNSGTMTISNSTISENTVCGGISQLSRVFSRLLEWLLGVVHVHDH